MLIFYFLKRLLKTILAIIFLYLNWLITLGIILAYSNQVLGKNIKKSKSYIKIAEVVTKSIRKKFAQSSVFNILKK